MHRQLLGNLLSCCQYYECVIITINHTDLQTQTESKIPCIGPQEDLDADIRMHLSGFQVNDKTKSSKF